VSLHKRLERLEALSSAKAGSTQNSRIWERFFHAQENARREIEGREPLPDLPYTEEDLQDDRRCLEETIPAYRASPGYQSGEGKYFLDEWEKHIRENLQRGIGNGYKHIV
jgi:hypothetical protein